MSPIPTATPPPPPTTPTRDATTTEAHGEIAQAKSEGKWGEEYTTCEKCGKHDWWKLSNGTFACKNCGFNTTGVKETSNVEVWEGGSDLVVLNTQVETKDTQSTGSQSGKGTVNVSTPPVVEVEGEGEVEVEVEKVALTKRDVASAGGAGKDLKVNVVTGDNENGLYRVVIPTNQFVKVTPEAFLSLNPVQAAADKRELTYLNSVLAYQIANAQKEQQYIASVQQQQQAALQREEAYAEMVLTAAAKLQQEADRREAAYLQSVKAAQVIAQKQLMTDSELAVKTPSIQKALIVY